MAVKTDKTKVSKKKTVPTSDGNKSAKSVSSSRKDADKRKTRSTKSDSRVGTGKRPRGQKDTGIGEKVDGPVKASRKETKEKRTKATKPRSTSSRPRKPTKSERANEAVASWIAGRGGINFELFNKQFSDAKLTETHFKTLYKRLFVSTTNSTSIHFNADTAAEYLKVITKGKARVGYDLYTAQVVDGTIVVRYFGDKDSLPLISFRGNKHVKPGRVIAKVINNTTLEVECIYYKLERDALFSKVNYIRVDKTGAHVRSGYNLKDEFAGTAKLRKQYTIETN